MSSDPTMYRGLVRDESEDASGHGGMTPFSISRGPEAEPTRSRPKLSLVTFLYVISTLMFSILAIMGVSYLSDISDRIRKYPSSTDLSTDAYSSVNEGSKSGFSMYKDVSGSLVARVPYSLVDKDVDILLVDQLTSGTGDRNLFLDAGTIISQEVVQFRTAEVGKLQLVVMQQDYRGNADLMRRSFPSPVICAFDIWHENDERYLIQLDAFLLSGIGTNGNEINAVLAAVYGAQYTYTMDTKRSAVSSKTTIADDYHVAVDRSLTYVLTNTAVTPLPSVGKQFTLSARKTLLMLDVYEQKNSAAAGQKAYVGFIPRPYHPMCGFNSLSYMDETAGLLGKRQQLSVIRHRLYPPAPTGTAVGAAVAEQRVGMEPAVLRGAPAGAHVAQEATSAAARPSTMVTSAASKATLATPNPTPGIPAHAQLVYFVDSAAPDGIREALTEGANWWDQAFQAAGYPAQTFYAVVADRAAFDAYNTHSPKRNFVEWVDRDWRSYSLGARLEDPRSGEILKGHVRIENLRMRQDALIAEALLGPFGPGESVAQTLHRKLQHLATASTDNSAGSEGRTQATSNVQEDVVAAILQRVRQLGAHEVGHTLGLAHNFAGSASRGGYGSVMDYPPPIVTVDATGTKLVLNSASYATGIGAFDKVSISYGYKQLGDITVEQERAALDALLQTAIAQGYVFLTDQDASVGAGDWRDTQWDSGQSPITALEAALTVRDLALRKLESADVLAAQDPYSQLQELFPLVYLWHRYEVEACAKLLGGYTFQYDTKSVAAGARLQLPVPGDMQLAAVQQLLRALDPVRLAISPRLAQRLVPAAFGYVPDIGGVGDLLPTRTGAGTFDLTASIEVAATLVLSALFNPARLERLSTQDFLDPTLPDLQHVLQTITTGLFNADAVHHAFSPAVNGSYMAAAALMTTQVVYTNYVINTVNDVTTHSFAVRTAAAQQLVIIPSILFNPNTPVNACAVRDGCTRYEEQWQTHTGTLKNAITALKPILLPLKTPLGPPI